MITETLGPKPAARDVNPPRPPGALPGQRWDSGGMWSGGQRGEDPRLSPLVARTAVHNVDTYNRQVSSPDQGTVLSFFILKP